MHGVTTASCSLQGTTILFVPATPSASVMERSGRCLFFEVRENRGDSWTIDAVYNEAEPLSSIRRHIVVSSTIDARDSILRFEARQGALICRLHDQLAALKVAEA